MSRADAIYLCTTGVGYRFASRWQCIDYADVSLLAASGVQDALFEEIVDESWLLLAGVKVLSRALPSVTGGMPSTAAHERRHLAEWGAT
ncbi:hypothetical protein P0D88_39115 [Paraburkholderia sp. RL18-103-BIB-C]|uniref:hypothetical protein n=1 Tax=unclassified Paraburkholderia TaxID=2615204 RepID=UPI0038B98B01